MTALNPDQFFHGTTHAVKGGMIHPADEVDKGVSEHTMGDPGDMSEGDHAFAIRNDEHYAWHAATTFHPSLRRPRVYEVEPAADMKPGPWHKDHPNFLEHHELDMPEGVDYDHEYHAAEVKKAQDNHQDEWASPTGFKVRQRIDIMPGRQGTFPGISWGRFGARQNYHGQLDHPTDSAVRYGTNEQQNQDAALKEHAERSKAQEPTRRETGQGLRDFMAGKPFPKPGEPNHPQQGLF